MTDISYTVTSYDEEYGKIKLHVEDREGMDHRRGVKRCYYKGKICTIT